MAFTNLSTTAGGTHATSEIDIWRIFRALRDARSRFGLRPGHLHTLQAMLSFLKPGHGDTVFASNASICQRIGGIDERTLRRHINRFVELGFIKRNDSSNRKRYRVRSSEGECISFGLSLEPLMQRADELIALAQEVERSRRDMLFLRKKILTKLAHLDEADQENSFVQHARRVLRRKLELSDYRALLAETDNQCKLLSTAVDTPETTKLSVNNGQDVRHHSKSEKDSIDTEQTTACETLNPRLLTSVCDQAASFATGELNSWSDIELHAQSLAPMMGIHPVYYEKAKKEVGASKVASAIFIILQLGERIKDLRAYFHSITLGKRRDQFDPAVLLKRLSQPSVSFG